MTPPQSAARVRLLASIFAFALLAVSNAPSVFAQSTRPSPAPAPQNNAGGVAPSGGPQTVGPATTRERRALAYAKMLEGQRHYAGARTGELTMDALRQSQRAFQQAAELDPTLAEARTALAELAFFFLNDLPQAEREAEAAVRADRDNLGARRVLSRVLTLESKLAEGNLDRATADRAVAELREIVRLRPNDAEAWALLGEFHLALGREAEAVEAFRRWAGAPAPLDARFYQIVTKGKELSPDAAHARLAEIYLRTNRPAEAVAAIRNALAIEPENQRYLGTLGEALEAAAVADQGAISELARIVARQPRNASAVAALARAQSRAGRVDDAVATLRAGAAAVAPGNERDQLSLRLQLAQTFDEASRYDEAVAVYDELLKARNIKDAPLASERDRLFASAVLSNVVSLRRRAGRDAEALNAIDRMRRLLGPADPTADIQHFELLRSQGKRAEALEAVRAARQRLPNDDGLLRLEASALADLGRVDEAVGLIRPRLKGDAGDFDEYLMLASLLMNAGRGVEAVEAARKALELASPEDPRESANALLMLSSAQERAGDFKGSEESLRRVLSKDPGNATALNNLGYFLTERNERLNEALEMIQRAVRAEPNNPSYLDSLGWVYFKLGKLDEAERYLRDAARRNPGSAAIQEHLGDLLNSRGMVEQARAAWRKALSLSTEPAASDKIKAKLGETRK